MKIGKPPLPKYNKQREAGQQAVSFLIQLVADVAAMMAVPWLSKWRFSLPVVVAISAVVIALTIAAAPE